MVSTTTKKSKTNTEKSVIVNESVSSNNEDSTKSIVRKKKVTSRDVNMMDLVDTQSCVCGQLVYVSKKTGYHIEWPELGAIQPLTVDELITMRNSQPGFFKNGWIRFIGDNAEEIASYLQVDKYFSNSFPYDNFDDVFELDTDEMISVISPLSDSMKESIARRAIDLIKDGTIDSKKKIAAIETATGFDLSE